MIWQSYWIKQKSLNFFFSWTTSSSDMKCHNSDLVVMGNVIIIFKIMISLVPLLWCHNCICRTLHPISMKNFECHLWIKWSTEMKFMMSSVTWFGSHIVFFILKKTFKNLLWSGWTDRGETLQAWPPIHEEQKVHKYDVISHMVWEP